MSRDNKQLGTFKLDGLPPAPRGMPQIEVTFDIDVNGILNVSAKDLGSGKEQKISITGSSGLSKEEVERMQGEAEAHAEDDRKAREEAEVRNNADNLAYQFEKQIKESGDKLPEDKRSGVEKAVETVRTALKGSDVEAIKTAYTDLQNQFQSVAADLSSAAGATADAGHAGHEGETAGASAGKKPAKGDVVDAEFEVVDDDKKKHS
jgi:molecular chaperone DnaK